LLEWDRAPRAVHTLGHCALSGGESANQQSAIASVKKPQRKGERFTELIRIFVVFHLLGSCPVECVNCPLSSRGARLSSKGIRSIREGSDPFESISVPVDIVRAKHQSSIPIDWFSPPEDPLGRSQDVIEQRLSYRAPARRARKFAATIGGELKIAGRLTKDSSEKRPVCR